MVLKNEPVEDLDPTEKKIFPYSPNYGWRDITSAVTVRGVGANDPDWGQIGSSPFYAYNFAVNDQCWFAFHIPHDIVPRSPIHFHAHWLPDGVDVNPVRWEWTYTYARGFNQEAYSMTGATAQKQQAGPGVAYQHMVTETGGIVIAELDEPDGIVYVRLRRITNGATENADNIFLLTSDIHYQTTDRATINKAPNFYGD